MTLVLSEVSKYGVVMVGDSAIESSFAKTDILPSGKPATPVYRTGCDKVKLIPNHSIGISFWGMGKIGGTPTDVWIEDYISNIVKPEDTFAHICEQLKERVNYDMKMSEKYGRGGFHVGTVMRPANGPSIPMVYHIHNGNGGHEWIPFSVQKDIPFGLGLTVEQYLAELERGFWRFIRNGYVESFHYIQNAFFNAMEHLGVQSGIRIPYPENIKTHESLMRLQVGVFADLIALSNQPPVIAKPITSLTIDLDGKTTYQSALADVSHL
jgi:hypothetical protein